VGRRPQALAVPTQAVVSDQTPMVYIVNSQGQIEERAVKLGLETPDRYEILDGLREGDLVVIGNHSGIQAGQTVQTQKVTSQSLNLQE
jgi:uncharacterized NAD(P)/FAD-binding protein YdhS